MSQRIVFLDRSSLRARVRPPAFAHSWQDYPNTHPQEVVERLRSASVAITNKVPLRAEALRQLPELPPARSEIQKKSPRSSRTPGSRRLN